jgi:hypothetical protein
MEDGADAMDVGVDAMAGPAGLPSRLGRITRWSVISMTACLPVAPMSLRASTRCWAKRARSAALTRLMTGLS